MLYTCSSKKQHFLGFECNRGEMLSKLGSAANMIVSDIQQNLANAKVGAFKKKDLCCVKIVMKMRVWGQSSSQQNLRKKGRK